MCSKFWSTCDSVKTHSVLYQKSHVMIKHCQCSLFNIVWNWIVANLFVSDKFKVVHKLLINQQVGNGLDWKMWTVLILSIHWGITDIQNKFFVHFFCNSLLEQCTKSVQNFCLLWILHNFDTIWIYTFINMFYMNIR